MRPAGPRLARLTEATVNRSQSVRRSVIGPSYETSMRILEYGICIVVVTAALLLGLVR
jgi:hypothetical protein